MLARLFDRVGLPLEGGRLFPLKERTFYPALCYQGRTFLKAGTVGRGVGIYREVPFHDLGLEDTPASGIKLTDD